jgi:hypothetical protein
MPSHDQLEKFCAKWIAISAIALEIVVAGVLENVNVSNSTVARTESPILVRLANRGRRCFAGVEKPAVGRINDVRISNITVYNAGKFGSSVTGIPGHCVKNIELSNITIHQKGGVTAEMMPEIYKKSADERENKYPEGTGWGFLPAKGFFVRHARNVKFSNIVIKTEQPDVRPDFLKFDVE